MYGDSQLPEKKSTRMHLTCVRMPCICSGMDGANKPALEARLIALDITDAAYRLWGELYEELICSGDEYGRGPSLAVAWFRYLCRGADNYPWYDEDDCLTAEGRAAYERFEEAFADGAGIYGFMHSA